MCVSVRGAGRPSVLPRPRTRIRRANRAQRSEQAVRVTERRRGRSAAPGPTAGPSRSARRGPFPSGLGCRAGPILEPDDSAGLGGEPGRRDLPIYGQPSGLRSKCPPRLTDRDCCETRMGSPWTGPVQAARQRGCGRTALARLRRQSQSGRAARPRQSRRPEARHGHGRATNGRTATVRAQDRPARPFMRAHEATPSSMATDTMIERQLLNLTGTLDHFLIWGGCGRMDLSVSVSSSSTGGMWNETYTTQIFCARRKAEWR